jgi:hypothetical protein
MTISNLLDARLARCLIVMLGVTVTSAAVPIPELMVRPVIPVVAPTTEQQLAQLQQQVQALQAQLTVLQAVVQITPASTAGQEPSVTIAAENLQLRAANIFSLQSGSTMIIRSSAELKLRSDGNAEVRAAGSLNMDGSLVRLNGGSKSLATVGSVVQTRSPNGVLSGQIVNGSQTVFSN